MTRPGVALAAIRLAAIPVFFAAERLVDHPAVNTAAFGELLALGGLYAVVLFGLEWRGRPLPPGSLVTAIDGALIVALVATSGGPFSQLRYAFFLLPLGAALLLRPAATALASVACVIAYAGIALTYPDAERVRADFAGFEATQGLFLAWMGAAATLLSLLLARRAREITELAASRGRLVAETLAAEDDARRRLAEALHDQPLQNVLAARQLLGAGELDLARRGLEEAASQLRDAMFDLHPSLLERAGLRAALQAVAERAARRAGFDARVRVDPAATGATDQLVFSVARELLANAARHARARRVDVAAAREDGAVVLTVADDGIGIDAAALAGALADGHIGLASCAQRAEAAGGRLDVRPRPGGGTLARLAVPAG